MDFSDSIILTPYIDMIKSTNLNKEKLLEE